MPDASRRTGTYFLKLNGLLLVSTCNDYSSLTEAPGNDLPYIMNLPTYAADAWYHGLLDETYQNMELEEFLEEVRAFAGGEYQSALFNYYPSGHMIYLHKPSLEKVHEQALEWYAK